MKKVSKPMVLLLFASLVSGSMPTAYTNPFDTLRNAWNDKFGRGGSPLTYLKSGTTPTANRVQPEEADTWPLIPDLSTNEVQTNQEWTRRIKNMSPEDRQEHITMQSGQKPVQPLLTDKDQAQAEWQAKFDALSPADQAQHLSMQRGDTVIQPALQSKIPSLADESKKDYTADALSMSSYGDSDNATTIGAEGVYGGGGVKPSTPSFRDRVTKVAKSFADRVKKGWGKLTGSVGEDDSSGGNGSQSQGTTQDMPVEK